MKMNIMVKRVIYAAVVLLVAAVLISGGMAFLVIKEALAESTAIILGHILISALVCIICCYQAVKAGKNRMQISLGVGVLYVAISLLTGLLISPKSDVKFDIWMAVAVLMSLFAGVLSSTKRERRR